MTQLTQTEFGSFHLDASRAPALDARPLDALIASVTFALSLAVLAYSLSVDARFPLCLLLHVAVLALPLGYLVIRARQNSDLTVPFLLLDRDRRDRADRRNRQRRPGADAVVAATFAVPAAAMVRLHFRRHRPQPRGASL